MVIYGDKLALRVRLDRLDLRNVVLPNTGECKLVKIFKVNHAILITDYLFLERFPRRVAGVCASMVNPKFRTCFFFD